MACRLKAAGANIAICGRNPEKLHETAVLAGGALELVGDLMDTAYLNGLPAKTADVFGGIDILINNAGLAQSKPFAEIAIEEYERIMQTNVRAPFFLTQRALPYLKASKGRVINVASVVAHKGYPLQSVYAASKHALLGFSKALANEVYQDGVRVHVISPGGVYTDMVRVARPDLSPEGLISVAEIADVMMFLLSMRGNAVVDEIEVRREGKAPFA